jgi:hypothetical protein
MKTISKTQARQIAKRMIELDAKGEVCLEDTKELCEHVPKGGTCTGYVGRGEICRSCPSNKANVLGILPGEDTCAFGQNDNPAAQESFRRVLEAVRAIESTIAAEANPYLKEELLQRTEPVVGLSEEEEEPWGVALPNTEQVDHPTHYNSDPSGVECIDIVRHRNFNIGNAIKYLWRNGLKDGNSSEQDLKKAIWYIQDEIERIKQ